MNTSEATLCLVFVRLFGQTNLSTNKCTVQKCILFLTINDIVPIFRLLHHLNSSVF